MNVGKGQTRKITINTVQELIDFVKPLDGECEIISESGRSLNIGIKEYQGVVYLQFVEGRAEWEKNK